MLLLPSSDFVRLMRASPWRGEKSFASTADEPRSAAEPERRPMCCMASGFIDVDDLVQVQVVEVGRDVAVADALVLADPDPGFHLPIEGPQIGLVDQQTRIADEARHSEGIHRRRPEPAVLDFGVQARTASAPADGPPGPPARPRGSLRRSSFEPPELRRPGLQQSSAGYPAIAAWPSWPSSDPGEPGPGPPPCRRESRRRTPRRSTSAPAPARPRECARVPVL